MITRCLLVGLGGCAGAIARYALGTWIDGLARRPFPLGTFVVNVSGCFLIGLVLSLTTSTNLRLLLATGVLGGFTTFSTFEYDTLALGERGAFGMAALNVVASVLVGLAAVKLGIVLAKR